MTGKPIVGASIKITSPAIDTKVKVAFQALVQLIKVKHLS
jgi:hypothetical protein